MPATVHTESHFTGGELVRDVVIGMSDGLTVPFALAAGLSGAVSTNWVIVAAGLAEIAAGSIAMGLGGYLAARTDSEHYASERQHELAEVREIPEVEAAEITEIFRSYGIAPEESAPVVTALRARPDAWVDFMMRFELGLEKPDPRRALRSAVTIAGSYIAGGAIPLGPYMAMSTPGGALGASACLTLAALFAFGWVKAKFTGINSWKGAGQTTLVGGIAATAAYIIARAVS